MSNERLGNGTWWERTMEQEKRKPAERISPTLNPIRGQNRSDIGFGPAPGQPDTWRIRCILAMR